LHTKRPKSVCGWDSAPDPAGGAYDAPPDLLKSAEDMTKSPTMHSLDRHPVPALESWRPSGGFRENENHAYFRGNWGEEKLRGGELSLGREAPDTPLIPTNPTGGLICGCPDTTVRPRV